MASEAYVGRNIDESVLDMVRRRLQKEGAEFVLDPYEINLTRRPSVHCARVAQNLFYFVIEGPTEDHVQELLGMFDGVPLQHPDDLPMIPKGMY